MFTPILGKPDRANGFEFRHCANYKYPRKAARAAFLFDGCHPGIYTVKNTETGNLIRYRVTSNSMRKCKDQYPESIMFDEDMEKEINSEQDKGV